mmetsp:Transcript_64425/g.119820  ORF Transcript_64425/g.119820 Transcript_64425/m.119820 type:complete len:374 (+) Transcript_64425:131-1252(+)
MASPASARFLAERGDGDNDALPLIIAAAAVCGLFLVLVFIYIFGCAPRVVLQAESRVIRQCKRRKRWSWDHIEQHLILGALPRWPCHLEELKRNGVGAVLSLNEQWEMAMSPTCIQADCGMDHRQLPTPDFFPPRQKDLVEAVAFISKHINAGTGVYVHCNAGKGRSACCVICYLIYAHGWTAHQAYDYVKERRRIAKLPMLCGTRAQWRAIKTFAKGLAQARRQVAPAPDPPPSAGGDAQPSGLSATAKAAPRPCSTNMTAPEAQEAAAPQQAPETTPDEPTADAPAEAPPQQVEQQPAPGLPEQPAQASQQPPAKAPEDPAEAPESTAASQQEPPKVGSSSQAQEAAGAAGDSPEITADPQPPDSSIKDLC